MGSVAEESKLSSEESSMGMPTALDDLEDHLAAAEDLLRDGDEAGALEHIGLAEDLIHTREGWQAVDGVRKHHANHMVLIRKTMTLLAASRPRDAMEAADEALRHGSGQRKGAKVSTFKVLCISRVSVA